MMNLLIKAHLSNGFAGNDPDIPLDGVLLRQHLINKFGINFIHNFNPEVDEFRYPDDFPLRKKYVDTAHWYYSISFGHYELIVEDIQHWHKRVRDEYGELIDFGKKRGKIDISSGKYRAYRMPIQVHVTKSIEWYAVGEKSNIENLLMKVTHIGKKASQGFGRVQKWHIQSISKDWSEVKDGKWTRAIPAVHLDVSMARDWTRRTYRPPYWYQQNDAMCTEKGSIVCNSNSEGFLNFTPNWKDLYKKSKVRET